MILPKVVRIDVPRLSPDGPVRHRFVFLPDLESSDELVGAGWIKRVATLVAELASDIDIDSSNDDFDIKKLDLSGQDLEEFLRLLAVVPAALIETNRNIRFAKSSIDGGRPVPIRLFYTRL